MTHQFPLEYGHGCFLVPIDIALAPLVVGALDLFQYRRCWATDADYEAGYAAFLELKANMSAVCVVELLERQDKLYRLIDTGLFGTEYTASGSPPVVSPPIPLAPGLTAVEPGLMARVKRLEWLQDNAYNGAVTPVWAAAPGIRTKLQEIIDAIAASGGGDEDILEVLVQIAALLA